MNYEMEKIIIPDLTLKLRKFKRNNHSTLLQYGNATRMLNVIQMLS